MEILNIQKFCTHDGPGIRTTVFLKGCPLHCLWCHNPESIDPRPQKIVDRSRCISCGRCETLCDESVCRFCGACAEACLQEAITIHGKTMTSEEIFEAVMADRVFYETSGGGVTFSGGEPLLQAKTLKPLMVKLKQAGCHIALDTTGHMPYHVIESLLPVVDLWLYDLKGMDPVRHVLHTGVDNRQILDNLKRLAEGGHRLWIRMPLIEGMNTAEEEIEEAVHLIRTLSVEQINLLPYHRYGQDKFLREDLPGNLELVQPQQATLERIRHQMQKTGKPIYIGG